MFHDKHPGNKVFVVSEADQTKGSKKSEMPVRVIYQLDHKIEEVITVFYKNDHFVSARITKKSRTVHVFDGLDRDLDSWVPSATHTLKKVGWLPMNSSKSVVAFTPSTTRKIKGKWFVKRDTTSLKQTDGHNCGPISCAAIWHWLNPIEAKISAMEMKATKKKNPDEFVYWRKIATVMKKLMARHSGKNSCIRLKASFRRTGTPHFMTVGNVTGDKNDEEKGMKRVKDIPSNPGDVSEGTKRVKDIPSNPDDVSEDSSIEPKQIKERFNDGNHGPKKRKLEHNIQGADVTPAKKRNKIASKSKTPSKRNLGEDDLIKEEHRSVKKLKTETTPSGLSMTLRRRDGGTGKTIVSLPYVKSPLSESEGEHSIKKKSKKKGKRTESTRSNVEEESSGGDDERSIEKKAVKSSRVKKKKSAESRSKDKAASSADDSAITVKKKPKKEKKKPVISQSQVEDVSSGGEDKHPDKRDSKKKNQKSPKSGSNVKVGSSESEDEPPPKEVSTEKKKKSAGSNIHASSGGEGEHRVRKATSGKLPKVARARSTRSTTFGTKERLRGTRSPYSLRDFKRSPKNDDSGKEDSGEEEDEPGAKMRKHQSLQKHVKEKRYRKMMDQYQQSITKVSIGDIVAIRPDKRDLAIRDTVRAVQGVVFNYRPSTGGIQVVTAVGVLVDRERKPYWVRRDRYTISEDGPISEALKLRVEEAKAGKALEGASKVTMRQAHAHACGVCICKKRCTEKTCICMRSRMKCGDSCGCRGLCLNVESKVHQLEDNTEVERKGDLAKAKPEVEEVEDEERDKEDECVEAEVVDADKDEGAEAEVVDADKDDETVTVTVAK
eukprot:Pompholyxophrys_punicea_v1_NODE_2_length_10808_cov_35.677950.p1 type:complete len:832 gc:universal NODE_2_length_10808_cov_35.677950:9483-6988(-)